jgi:hypothetical protein
MVSSTTIGIVADVQRALLVDDCEPSTSKMKMAAATAAAAACPWLRLPAAPKRIAVPFRAADTPDERSEFAQPDVALLLSHLAYYRDGLSKQELKAALQVSSMSCSSTSSMLFQVLLRCATSRWRTTVMG